MTDDRLHRQPAPPGVDLWLTDLRPRVADAASAHLTAEDRVRLAGLPPTAGAQLLARRALLRTAVAAVAGCAPDDVVPVRASGPRAVRVRDGRTLFVSVSASGDRGLVAVAAAPVGVDLERLPAPPDALVVSRELLHPHEHAWISADDGDPGERFLATWVRKEAVVKCTGEGMSRDLRTFVVDARRSPAPVTGALTDEHGAPLGMTTYDVVLDDHLAALAVTTPLPQSAPGPRAAGHPTG